MTDLLFLSKQNL